MGRELAFKVYLSMASHNMNKSSQAAIESMPGSGLKVPHLLFIY